ncbi:hypothetical protein [Bradyrhizobium sp. Arg816]|uniref:hypothetical protein n=1 Tax=Bradyrhizobium sp. Arg816 TaxID=2998491 RepID=UPI00249DA054|nr:hypothetical protein [Bradyrhizobium sp. Arg816]MDI3561731.1 hypothetical protein [Bradyrhizobium sp. Arg816]
MALSILIALIALPNNVDAREQPSSGDCVTGKPRCGARPFGVPPGSHRVWVQLAQSTIPSATAAPSTNRQSSGNHKIQASELVYAKETARAKIVGVDEKNAAAFERTKELERPYLEERERKNNEARAQWEAAEERKRLREERILADPKCTNVAGGRICRDNRLETYNYRCRNIDGVIVVILSPEFRWDNPDVNGPECGLQDTRLVRLPW